MPSAIAGRRNPALRSEGVSKFDFLIASVHWARRSVMVNALKRLMESDLQDSLFVRDFTHENWLGTRERRGCDMQCIATACMQSWFEEHLCIWDSLHFSRWNGPHRGLLAVPLADHVHDKFVHRIFCSLCSRRTSYKFHISFEKSHISFERKGRCSERMACQDYNDRRVEKAEQIAVVFLLELRDELSGHRPTAVLPNTGCIPHQVSLAGVCFHFSAASRQKDGGQRMANAHEPFSSSVVLISRLLNQGRHTWNVWSGYVFLHWAEQKYAFTASGGKSVSQRTLTVAGATIPNLLVYLHHQRAMLLTH